MTGRPNTPPHGNDCVVTGLGVISALGSTIETFRAGLLEGMCGIKPGVTFRCGTPARFPVGEVKELDALCDGVFDGRKARRFDPVARMTLYACLKALQDSGHLDRDNRWIQADPRRVGLVLGTGIGGIQSTELFFRKVAQGFPQSANPSLFPETVPNASTGHLTIELGIQGPSTTLTQRQSSTECALSFALDLLQSPDIDLVVTGAVEDVTHWHAVAHESCRSLGHRLQPFDRDRSGTALGEGGAIFILERSAPAKQRGAKIYGRVGAMISGGVPCPVGTWPKLPHAEKIAGTLRRFLATNSRAAENVSWINASALGSGPLDALENQILSTAIGRKIPVSSLHGALGSFNCSSSLRIAAALLAIREGFIPPSVGLENPESQDLDHVVATARRQPVEKVLVHTLSDGGAYAFTLLSA